MGILSLGPFSSDSPSQLDILWHDGHTLGVDCTQVGVLEQTNEVGLGCLLECEHSGGLEAKVSLEILGDLANETLEWELADQELGGLLVPADLTESDGSWPVSVGLLDSSGSGSRLAGSLGGQLLPGGLASGGLSCGLLGTGHCDSSDETDASHCPAACFIGLVHRPPGALYRHFGREMAL